MVLTKNEETRLLEGAGGEGGVSVLKLADDGLRLSILVAKKYENKAEIGNLIRAGFRGWILAYAHFDKTKNYKLSTYSTWWIKQEIEKYLKKLKK